MKICSIAGCEGPHKAKGFCWKHWWRHKKYGDPLTLKQPKRGNKKHPNYGSWRAMIQRCHIPSSSSFNWEIYGGRGIKVCDRWRYDFWTFVGDMGVKPLETSLDRIDSNGDYEPGNCRWMNRKGQNRNRSSCVLDHQIVSEARQRHEAGTSVAALSREFGVPYQTLRLAVRGHTWS